MKKSKSSPSKKRFSRRAFLRSTSSAVVGSALLINLDLNASSAEIKSGQIKAQAQPGIKVVHGQRLLTGWDYRRGSLGGVWGVWRKANDDATTWASVELPHCFNALDAVDPDAPYYQGPGWYRTRLQLKNPYPGGRTLLHFEGAGQKTEVYVFTSKVGEHVGGYDEFTVDITESAASALKNETNKGLVPVAILCDSSRDLEMIPSNLSDFNLYGGLYRYVNLLYVPAISLERVHVVPELLANGKAKIIVRGRLYNPAELKDQLELKVFVLDANNREIHSHSTSLKQWTGTIDLATFVIDSPVLWSPKKPSLYRCIVTVGSDHGISKVVKRFGLRSFEFVKNGPFKLNGERLLIRGTQRHEDHAGVAAAMTEDQMRDEMRLIKNLGAN